MTGSTCFLWHLHYHRHTLNGFCFSQHTMLQLIKEAWGQNGITPRDESPVTEVLNQVCPSSWRGACKTAVQLLFAQAGLVSTPQKCCIKTHWGPNFQPRDKGKQNNCIGVNDSCDYSLSWIGFKKKTYSMLSITIFYHENSGDCVLLQRMSQSLMTDECRFHLEAR